MAWILDVIFFVALLIGCIVGCKVGFVKGVCKVGGWVFSLVAPFVFCVALKDALESWFGLVSIIAEGVGNATVAGWITIAISFVGLFILVRLGTWLLGLLLDLLAKTIPLVKIVNIILGGILGMVEAFLILYFLILICGWLNIDAVTAFVNESWVVGAIFRSNLMAYLPF